MLQRMGRYVVAGLVLGCVVPGGAQARRVVSERIEWTYEVAPEKPDAALPNVLLIGDSITRAYSPDVTKELEGKANVYYLATSASIADVRLPRQIAEYFAMLSTIHWDVVHFNNGMHGWGYSEQDYGRYFGKMVGAVKAGAPGAKLVWAMTTPIRKDQAIGATNARIEARNGIAAKVVQREGIPVDDQHELMLAHQDLHADDIHFKAEGSAIQAKQVAASVWKALGK